MAKKRKSIFDTDTSNDEIKDAALNVQKETLPSPDKKEVRAKKKNEATPSSLPKEGKSGKLMHLYVDGNHHKQAKVNATLKGMKLGEYIEWLIEQDKSNNNY